MSDEGLRVMAPTIACLLGLWTAIACRQGQCRGLPGSDALIWASLSGAFFLLSLMRTARGLGFLQGFGRYLRDIFKQRCWYEDRRTLQIADCCKLGYPRRSCHLDRVGPAVGLASRQAIPPRYRPAGLTLGFAVIRFISLHEIDAWNSHAPWAPHRCRPRCCLRGIGSSHRSTLAVKAFCLAKSQDLAVNPGR
jgi:hypothetical protein